MKGGIKMKKFFESTFIESMVVIFVIYAMLVHPIFVMDRTVDKDVTRILAEQFSGYELIQKSEDKGSRFNYIIRYNDQIYKVIFHRVTTFLTDKAELGLVTVITP